METKAEPETIAICQMTTFSVTLLQCKWPKNLHPFSLGLCHCHTHKGLFQQNNLKGDIKNQFSHSGLKTVVSEQNSLCRRHVN